MTQAIYILRPFYFSRFFFSSLALLLLALSVAHGSQAVEPSVKSALESRFQNHWAHRIQRFDKNGDGLISREEIVSSDEKFSRLDADSDGLVNEEEFMAVGKKKWSAKGAQASENVFRARKRVAKRKAFFAWLDANKDGYLQPFELRAPKLKRFDNLDANGDGMLTRAEARRHHEQHAQRVRQYFVDADLDASGGLSLKEFRALANKMRREDKVKRPFKFELPNQNVGRRVNRKFAKIDDDGNGEISLEELFSARKKRR